MAIPIQRTSPDAMSRDRLFATAWPAAIYAVGDVHGCNYELGELERAIAADASQYDGERWIVMLGDYVDRGPATASVLDRLLRPAPAGFRRICLAGNHEAMLLAYLDQPVARADWLKYGGLETLASYGISASTFLGTSDSGRRDLLKTYIPQAHLAFMHDLPAMLALPGAAFVHAGIRPGVSLGDQIDPDLLWIRRPFLDDTIALDQLVVHGHTPRDRPDHIGNRVGIDTACFASGVLTAACIAPDGKVRFIST